MFVRVDDAGARARVAAAGLLDARHDRRAVDGGEARDARSTSRSPRAGLRALGVPTARRSDVLGRVPAGHGRARRAARRRRATSDPGRWEAGLGTGAAHVLLTVNAQDERRRSTPRCAELRGGAARRRRLAVVHEEHARLLAGAREHFGFADGFAQPAIEGVSERPGAAAAACPRPTAAGGRSRPASSSSATRTRTRASTRSAGCRARRPTRSAATGTYMVWRKLHQDVALFRRALRDAAAPLRRRRRGEARGQGRRPLARRHAARALARRAASRTSTPRARRQRLPLRRRRSRRPALPARRAHPPRRTRATRSASRAR